MPRAVENGLLLVLCIWLAASLLYVIAPGVAKGSRLGGARPGMADKALRVEGIVMTAVIVILAVILLLVPKI